MTLKSFLPALLILAAIAGPCRAQGTITVDRDDTIDDSIVGPNGYVYKVSPTDKMTIANTPKNFRPSNDHSGIGSIQSGSIASQALKFNQPYGSYNWSSAHPY